MNGKRQNGFTLIDLMIALAVASVMLAMIPITRSYIPMVQVNRAVRGMAQTLREARSMAVKNGNDVIMTFDVANGIFNVYSDADYDGIQLADLVKSYSLTDFGDGIAFTSPTTTGVDGQMIAATIAFGNSHDPIAVTFRPNGSTREPGAIYLTFAKSTQADLGRAIEVLTTGRVQSWSFDINGSPGPWGKFL